MSGGWWFLVGWLSASVFIAIGIWLHGRPDCDTPQPPADSGAR